MKLSFTELHSPLFHGGKNFTGKIFADKEIQMELVVREIDGFQIPFVQLTYRNKPTLLPMTSINHLTEEHGLVERPTNAHHTQDIAKFQGAQVGSPMDHVFAGPGKGKGVGKPAKTQGE